MSRVVAWAVVGVVLVGLLAGCSSGRHEPPKGTASPSAVAESPTPSPTPTGESVIDPSDPKLGIVFTKMPVLTGDAAAALNGLSFFESEFWRALSTGKVDPIFMLIASSDVQAIVQAQVDGNIALGVTIHGTLTESVNITRADAGTAVGTTCQDFSGVTFTNARGTFTAAEGGIVDKYLFDVTLSRPNGAGWIVETYKENGTC
jgi:hypothetical protein